MDGGGEAGERWLEATAAEGRGKKCRMLAVEQGDLPFMANEVGTSAEGVVVVEKWDG